MPNTRGFFEPLEHVTVSVMNWRIMSSELWWNTLLAFPFRIGGPGLQNPEETADFEYANFTLIASKLTAQVCSQKLGNSRDHEHSRTINSIMKELNDFTCRMPWMPWIWPTCKATHKRSSGERRVFLALSNAIQSYWVCPDLNEEKFIGSICMRETWKINGTPTRCACEKTTQWSPVELNSKHWKSKQNFSLLKNFR